MYILCVTPSQGRFVKGSIGSFAHKKTNLTAEAARLAYQLSTHKIFDGPEEGSREPSSYGIQSSRFKSFPDLIGGGEGALHHARMGSFL
jgi:hypothetical protein